MQPAREHRQVAELADAPALRRDASENSGTLMPLWRRIMRPLPRARASTRAIAAIERRRLDQQADHDERFAREVEEVSRDARAHRPCSSSSSTSDSSERSCGTCTTADQPPSTAQHVDRRDARAASVRSDSRLRRTRARICARIAGAAARSAPPPRPAPASTPTDRCRRSFRRRPALRRPSPTGRRIQSSPSFSCGRPADFDSPPRLKVSTSAPASTCVASGAGSSG